MAGFSSFFFISRGLIGVVHWYHDAMLLLSVAIIHSSQFSPSFFSLFTHAVSCGFLNLWIFGHALYLSNTIATSITSSDSPYSTLSLFLSVSISFSFVILLLVIISTHFCVSPPTHFCVSPCAFLPRVIVLL